MVASASAGVPAGADIDPRRRHRSAGLPRRATEVVAAPASIARSALGTVVTRKSYRLSRRRPFSPTGSCVPAGLVRQIFEPFDELLDAVLVREQRGGALELAAE